MNEYITNNLVRIPIAIYAIGFLIHNFYLSQYQIYDFEIIQARYIYVGFTSAAFISSVYFFATLRLNLSNFGSNFSLKKIYFWAYRISLFSIVFYFMLFSTDTVKHIEIPPLYALLSEKNYILIVYSIPTILFFYIIISSFDSGSENSLLFKFTNVITAISSPVIIILALILNYYIDSFSGMYLLFILIWVSVISFIMGAADAENGSQSTHLDENTKNTTKKKHGHLFAIFSLGFLLLLLMNTYSKNIYPLMPTGWGGGKPIEARLTTEKKHYTGKLISESVQWTYIIDNGDNVIKIKTDTINEILLINVEN